MANTTIRKPYNETDLKHLEESMERNEVYAYEVTVNDITLVSKTTDMDRFWEFKERFDPEREFKVEFRVFSNENTFRKYEFSYKPPAKTLNGTLPGADYLSQHLAGERLRWDHDHLKEKNREQSRKIERLEGELELRTKQCGELEKENEELRNRKLVLGNINLAELGSVLVEGMIRRNTHLLARHPLTKGLAGIIDHDNQESNQLNGNNPDGLSEEDAAYLDLLRKIESAFSPDDFMEVLNILDKLIESPNLIEPVSQYLSQQSNPHEDENL